MQDNPASGNAPGLPAVDWNVLRAVLTSALTALGGSPDECDAAALKESMRLQRLAAHVSTVALSTTGKRK